MIAVVCALTVFAVISPSLLGWATMLALPMGILAGVVVFLSRPRRVS